MMDTFQCTDGKPISESELYDWQNPWKNRDPRLDLYCVRSGSRTMGIQFSTDPADKTVYDYISGTSVTNSDVTGNKSEYGPNGIQGPGGFLWRKFCDPPTTAASRAPATKTSSTFRSSALRNSCSSTRRPTSSGTAATSHAPNPRSTGSAPG